MFRNSYVCSSFSVNDAAKAKEFYGAVLGFDITETPGLEEPGMFDIMPSNSNRIIVYEKLDHQPASYTILNIAVGNIDDAVVKLEAQGVGILRYPYIEQDEKGISRGLSFNGPPDIA